MRSDAVFQRLSELSDPTYRDFHAGLIPNISPETILGVRVPALRKLARELRGSAEAQEFMTALPHEYYDENCLHGLLINDIKDFGATVSALDAFLPYVDNWAVCDLISPRSFKSRPPELAAHVHRWLDSSHSYTVRFGIGVLMSFYLDEGFEPAQLEAVAERCCEEYYVNMMVAWYFATALAKQPEAALPYIENRRLSRWTHNKAIQKSIESRRIPDETKAYLKTLRRWFLFVCLTAWRRRTRRACP